MMHIRKDCTIALEEIKGELTAAFPGMDKESKLIKTNLVQEGGVMASVHLCEGKCERHVGKVQRVHVYIPSVATIGMRDWGKLWYCQAAITEDRARGFTVDIEEA